MDAAAYREQLYDTFTEANVSPGERIERALDIGTEYLDLSIGFLTRIEDGTQYIEQATGEHESLQPGASCPLDEAYCRRTIKRDDALAVQDVVASSAIAQRAVETFGLGTYIGVKVTVDDAVYGTVCFADRRERGVPFTEAEEVFVELLAKLVGRAFERQAYEDELEARNDRLRREKERFRSIAETSFDIIYRIDMDGHFSYLSPAVEDILGYSPRELVGAPFTAAIAERSVAAAEDAFEGVRAGERVENLELEFLDSDGAPVVMEINSGPIREDGAVVGSQGVARDITARKEREQELRIKNRAMEESHIGMSIAAADDPDAPLVYVNDGFEAVTGYDEADVLGRNCRFLQGPATDPASIGMIRDGIADNEPMSVEILNYRRDGAPFWNQVRVSPVANAAGEVTHYLGFQDDITDRKRTEQLVRLLNRVLRHNLRNDMNVVLGLGSDLQRHDDPEVAKKGRSIARTAQTLVDLSEQARELEKTARQDRAPDRLDTAELVASLVETYRETYPAATIASSVETERDICAGAETERALGELVQNAVKHNPADEPRVDIRVLDDGDDISIVVEDDGPGVDAMETAVIATGEETALEHGSGLGLWLTNWIVTRYGGSFQLDGSPSGTVATVELPAIEDGLSVDEAARRPTVLFR
jgi:PAS domain S-box-containing protein